MTRGALPMRTPLEALALEFPRYRISMQTIWDKLFYLAEATESGVQPRFAQAESAERLRAKLTVPVRPFTATQPSIARVWDVLLGGKDNFVADREQAASLLKVFPQASELARESRQFQARAVAHAAARGVRQFLDLGCGLPTAPNTHETAQAVQPDAVVVYVDNDEQVLTHAGNVLGKAPGVYTVAGDLGHPDEILYDWRVRRAVDFFQPIGLIMAMTLHFYDADKARQLTRLVIDNLPYGSYLVMSVGQLDGKAAGQFSRQYAAQQTFHHDRETVTGFLHDLDVAEPGVTEARTWRLPGSGRVGNRRGHIWAAVGRKTGGLP